MKLVVEQAENGFILSYTVKIPSGEKTETHVVVDGFRAEEIEGGADLSPREVSLFHVLECARMYFGLGSSSVKVVVQQS